MFIQKISCLSLIVSASLVAGGFVLEFGNPRNSSDPKAKGAITIVRALGCHEPEKAQLSASAEGLVSGNRQSVPLELVKLDSSGMWAIKGAIPTTGSWVISVIAKEHGEIRGSALATVRGDGSVHREANLMGRTPNPEDVNPLLASAR
jgi:hypothetical protein